MCVDRGAGGRCPAGSGAASGCRSMEPLRYVMDGPVFHRGGGAISPIPPTKGTGPVVGFLGLRCRGRLSFTATATATAISCHAVAEAHVLVLVLVLVPKNLTRPPASTPPCPATEIPPWTRCTPHARPLRWPNCLWALTATETRFPGTKLIPQFASKERAKTRT
jgi:hypothetical protein